ncbi:MAG: hypothetical protein GY906_09190 [bacterium]|nr:hypothetical protein [bacterium]
MKSRRKAALGTDDPVEDCIGLALSGGGIRSATFNLGVLQALGEKGVLKLVDYLCTVSGGGYIGGCLSSLMTATSGSAKWKRDGKFDMGQKLPLRFPEQIHHLRTHGDFLILREGIARREVLRTVGTVLVGLVSTLGLFLSAMMAVAGLFVFLTAHLGGEQLWPVIMQEPVHLSWSMVFNRTALSFYAYSSVIGMVVTVVFWLRSFWWPPAYGRIPGQCGAREQASPDEKDPESTIPVSSAETVDEREQRTRLFEFVTVLAIIGMFSWVFFAPHLPGGEMADQPSESSAAAQQEHTPEEGAGGFAVRTDADSDLVAVIVNAEGAEQNDDEDKSTSHQHPNFGRLLVPTGYSLGIVIVTGFLYAILPNLRERQRKSKRETQTCKDWTSWDRSLFGAMVGIGLYFLATSLLCLAAILALWWAREQHQWIAGASLISLIASRMSIQNGSDSGIGKWLKKVPMRLILSSALLVALASVFLTIANLIVKVSPLLPTIRWLHFSTNNLYLVGGLTAIVIGTVLFLFTSWIVNFNKISPHYFYRDRLAEAYLRTDDHDITGNLGVVRDDQGLPLSILLKREDLNPAPYHLILSALNLTGSRDLARKDRKSDHFIFSPYYCGSTTTGYVDTQHYRSNQTRLSEAMTISGAAASSGMGYATSFAQAFAATLFNVRLGMWLVNPRIYAPPDQQSQDDQSIYIATERSVDSWRANRSTSMKKRDARVRKRHEHRIFWPKFLFREMIAATNAEDRLVNLSDGGHTGDNIGLYPLLQRRCRVIIAGDAECDPDYTFGSLTAAARQIFTDENVDVEMRLATIRPTEKEGLPSAHFAIGKISYPDDPEPGWIIYLKSSYTGTCEPATVTSYAVTHETFPHQSTADQFFDDDQFEAYRALGMHIAKHTIGEAERSGEVSQVDGLVNWCKKQWKDGNTQSEVS